MSWWDRYLAPGDIRTVQAKVEATVDEPATTTPAPRQRPPRLDDATRARRQNGLLIGGICFTALSVLITRRGIARKMLVAQKAAAAAEKGAPVEAPKLSNNLDAVEALTYATLNVFSVGMMSVGAIFKIFDIADIEDMRDKVRRGVGFDVYGGDAAADKEMEEWVAELMMKKDGTLKDGIVGKLAELEKLAKERDVKK